MFESPRTLAIRVAAKRLVLISILIGMLILTLLMISTIAAQDRGHGSSYVAAASQSGPPIAGPSTRARKLR